MRGKSEKGDIALFAALAMALIFLIVGAVRNRSVQLENRASIETLNHWESFYADEIAIWHNYVRNGGGMTFTPPSGVTADSSGAYPIPFQNQFSVLTGSLVGNYTPGSYTTGKPVNGASTVSRDPASVAIRRYTGSNVGYYPPNAGRYCAKINFPGSPRPYPLCLVIPPATLKVTAGYRSTCAVSTSGTLKCWGFNDVGQLGAGNYFVHGTASNSMSQLPVIPVGTGRTVRSVGMGFRNTNTGNVHTCVALDNGTVRCWGGPNQYAELGTGNGLGYGGTSNSIGDNIPLVSLGTGRTAISVSVGGIHTCALLDNRQVKCWGFIGAIGYGNTGSNLGDSPSEMGDNLPYIDVSPGTTVLAIAAGQQHTCMILNTGQVKCWGLNDNGQLGVGDPTERINAQGVPTVNLGTGRTATAIAVGGRFTCALLDDSSVKCWGHNGNGQLGTGTTYNHGDRTAANYAMGDQLPVVDLGTGRKAVAIAAADTHACAILENQKVKCWGNGPFLGLGISDSSRFIGDGPNEMGDNLPYVDLGNDPSLSTNPFIPVSISAASHVCAVSQLGRIKCWGKNEYGELGVSPDGDTRGDGPNEMGNLLPFAGVTWP